MSGCLEVLICTIGKDGIERIAMHGLPQVKNVKWLVSWQLPGYGNKFEVADIPEVLKNRRDVKIKITDSRGLCRNRNNALQCATGDYLLVADDDEEFSEEGFRNLIEEFEEHPEIDVLTLQFSAERNGKEYPTEGFELSKTPRGYYVSSIEIAMRRGVVEKGLRFNERFGIGGEFIGGEEDVLIKDVMKLGLRGRYEPIAVGHIRNGRTGVERRNTPEFVEAKGAVFRYLYPGTWWLRMFVHAIRWEGMNRFEFLRAWIRGARKL